MYVPAAAVGLAHAPYQTVVTTAGFAAAEVRASCEGVPLLAGTPAKVTLGTAPLASELVGPAPKPLNPSTRHPHVFVASAVGDTAVPLDAVRLFDRYVIEVLVPLVVIVRL